MEDREYKQRSPHKTSNIITYFPATFTLFNNEWWQCM